MAGPTPTHVGTWSRAGLVLAAVVLLDQVTKKLIKDGIALGDEDAVFPAVKLVHTQNRGVAFSALEGRGALVSIVIGLAVLGLLVYVARHVATPYIWVPTGLLTGGALGNVIDRVRDGAVTDFVKLPAGPAFNVADWAITLGVLTLLYVMEKDSGDEAADTSPAHHVGVPDAADRRA
jgi:signal peptidase II